MIRLIDAVSRWLAKGTIAISVAMFAAMLIALAYQVAARYLFNAPPVWTEEFSLIMFTWIVLLMGSAGIREGIHVCLDAWPDTTPRPVRLIGDAFVNILTLGVGIVLLTSGWAYVVDTQGQLSAAINYPIEALHAAAPVAGGLIALHAFAALLSPAPRTSAQ